MGNGGRLSPTAVSHLNKKRTIHLLQNRTFLFVANNVKVATANKNITNT
jgi:hypothetical protein